MVTSVRMSVLETAKALIDEGAQATALADSAKAADPAKARAYATDRFTKAANLLNLMEQKMPGASSPYSLRMPQDMAVAWHTGEATNNQAYKQKAQQIVHDEILRYSGNLVYYQGLNPRQYNTLQNVDKYIDHYYVLDLVHLYMDMGGDGEKMLLEMSQRGVNLDRLAAAQQATEESLNQNQ